MPARYKLPSLLSHLTRAIFAFVINFRLTTDYDANIHKDTKNC